MCERFWTLPTARLEKETLLKEKQLEAQSALEIEARKALIAAEAEDAAQEQVTAALRAGIKDLRINAEQLGKGIIELEEERSELKLDMKQTERERSDLLEAHKRRQADIRTLDVFNQQLQSMLQQGDEIRDDMARVGVIMTNNKWKNVNFSEVLSIRNTPVIKEVIARSELFHTNFRDFELAQIRAVKNGSGRDAAAIKDALKRELELKMSKPFAKFEEIESARLHISERLSVELSKRNSDQSVIDRYNDKFQGMAEKLESLGTEIEAAQSNRTSVNEEIARQVDSLSKADDERKITALARLTADSEVMDKITSTDRIKKSRADLLVQLQQSRKADAAARQAATDTTSTITRSVATAGAIGIAIMLIQIFVNAMRYYARLAETYSAQADALRASGGNPALAIALIDSLSPDKIDFGKTPSSLYEKAFDAIGSVAKSRAKG